ncbi:MAG: hypothetical protein IPP27_16125 [Bacteroidetes bacterium]|nr:hypothetical protein [Bacteroidota bacterium]
MYNELYNCLKVNYHDRSLQEIRRQSKSIGLIFLFGNKEIKIDVVPIRDINDDRRDSAGNLYRRPETIFSKAGYTKTDIQLQASDFLTPAMKKVIIILKNETDKNIPMSSYMIQVFVQEAFSKNCHFIPVGFTQKVMMVLKHIKENIYTSKLTSIENSNNHLNTLSVIEKDQVFDSIKSLLDEYDYHPNTLKTFISS